MAGKLHQEAALLPGRRQDGESRESSALYLDLRHGMSFTVTCISTSRGAFKYIYLLLPRAIMSALTAQHIRITCELVRFIEHDCPVKTSISIRGSFNGGDLVEMVQML